MTLSHDDFRSKILWSSTQGVASVFNLLCKAEISYSQMTIRANQEVFWLEISVCNLLAVQMFECQCYLSDVEKSNIVREHVLLPEQSKDFTTLHEVEYKVKVLFILECFK